MDTFGLFAYWFGVTLQEINHIIYWLEIKGVGGGGLYHVHVE